MHRKVIIKLVNRGSNSNKYTQYNNQTQRVSEWLLFNGNSAIFQDYDGENKLMFNEMMMRSDLY